jgi:ribose 5-phosphate isomerase B
MHIALGADHAGFLLKDALKRTLDELGATYEDFGTASAEAVDYPDLARAVAQAVAGGGFDRGILVCGSGVGMAIAANKVRGIRAAVMADAAAAALARQHNDLNVLTLGARQVPEARAGEIVKAFLATPFAAGRHGERVRKIHAIES